MARLIACASIKFDMAVFKRSKLTSHFDNLLAMGQRRGVAQGRLARLIVPMVLAVACATMPVSAPVVARSEASGVVTSPASTYSCLWHRVKRGDTLLGLAWQYGVSADAIKQANRMRGNRIYLGTLLCIPRAQPHPQPPPKPNPSPQDGPWHGEYWNNTAQSGVPSLTRQDSDVDFSWGYGTPNAGRIFADNFSARWTRTYPFLGGTYRFTLTHDDGARLYVGGNLLINQYDFVGVKTDTVDVYLPPGAKVITVDYVEKGGLARVKMDWVRLSPDGGPQPPPNPNPPPQHGSWQADFFNNQNLIGAPVYARRFEQLNFNWGKGSAGANVPADNWSARFTTGQQFAGGTYRFVARVDDGVRVYVDGQLIMNEWREQPYRTFVNDISLGAGQHYVTVEYMDVGGEAALQVYWERR